jgi:hypothetical protein
MVVRVNYNCLTNQKSQIFEESDHHICSKS